MKTNRITKMDNILTISLIVQSLIATVISSSSALLHRRNLKRRHDRHRTLITGVVACSGCASANNECVSRTIGMDDQCGACANGQSYWPCDIENECWCWDTTLPRDPGDGNPDDCYDTNGDGKCDEYLGIAGQGGTEFTGEIVLPPCFTPCANSFTGNEAVPGTGCRIYHECYLGDIRSKKECGTPLIFDEIRDYCEFPSAVLCPLGNNVVCPDPETVSPTVAPISEIPTTCKFGCWMPIYLSVNPICQSYPFFSGLCRLLSLNVNSFSAIRITQHIKTTQCGYFNNTVFDKSL